MNVLLIYPNINKQLQIQMGLASISAVLKSKGYKVDLFDSTSIIDLPFDKIVDLFKEKILDFKPDVLLVGCRSFEFPFTVKLLKYGNKTKIPVIIGGQHPTVSPEEVITKELVDYICIGEGEEAIAELLERIKNKKNTTDVKNIWAKKDGRVYKNELRPLIQDLDKLPYPDWSIFDRKHISGTGRFETSRGCPYKCTYCINDFMQKLYKGKGKYHREKSIKRSVEEIEYFVKKYKFKDIFLIDETFTLDEKRVKEFCNLYKEKVNLPFIIMSRPEGISESKVVALKDAGCSSIYIGVESGSEEYRKKYLNRHTNQEDIIKAFLLCRKLKMSTYSFNMIGFPNETRKDIFKTIEINKKCKADVIQVTYFYPFKGTSLYDYSEQQGLIDHEVMLNSYYLGSVVHNPTITKKQMEGVYRTFVIYIKSPKILYPFIRLLELDNLVSINLCRIINTFITQGFNPKAFKFLFEHLLKNVLKIKVRSSA